MITNTSQDGITQQEIDTVLQTAVAAAPLVAQVAGASVNPGISAALQLAPVAISALQQLTQLTQAGAMDAAQLAAMFSSIGQGIEKSHTAWQEMNAQNTPQLAKTQAA